METDIQTLKDLFKISYEAFESSREEEKEIRDLYHNRQYTQEQLAALDDRNQPKETFNILKLFGRTIIGFYSTVVNTVKIKPRQLQDIPTALLLHDVIQYVFEQNQFDIEGDKIKLDALISGLMCVYFDVVDTGQVDKFNYPIRQVEVSHIPSREILLDPLSYKEDYSDGRFIHRFKWVSEGDLKKLLKKSYKSDSKIQEVVDTMNEYENHVNKEDAEYDNYYPDKFVGYYKQYKIYLVVHTVIINDKDETESIFWCGDIEISREILKHKFIRFPYRVQKTHSSDKSEYYGIFREIKETQHAINQSLVRLQLMVNTQKVFVETSALIDQDLDKFTGAVERVNSVIEVRKLSGVRIENLSREVLDQYVLIDKALERAQKLLGITDSFLGAAYASDSGRKVKLQQNASIMSLRYNTTKIQQLYKLTGKDILNLIKQYYKANQVINITDKETGERWIEINKPLETYNGKTDSDGNAILEPQFENETDNDGKPIQNEHGEQVIKPVVLPETDISVSDVDVIVEPVAYNDEDEKTQLMLENVIQGTIGQVLASTNMAAYLEIIALTVKNTKTKYSYKISEIIENTSKKLREQQQQVQDEGGLSPEGAQAHLQSQGITPQSSSGQSPKSQELKLPTNTNEPVD